MEVRLDREIFEVSASKLLEESLFAQGILIGDDFNFLNSVLNVKWKIMFCFKNRVWYPHTKVKKNLEI